MQIAEYPSCDIYGINSMERLDVMLCLLLSNGWKLGWGLTTFRELRGTDFCGTLSSVLKRRQWDVMESDDSVVCVSGRNLFCPGRYRGINCWDPLCLEGTSVHLSINDRLKLSEMINLVDLRKFLIPTFCCTHPHFNVSPHSISLLNQNVKSRQTWTIPRNTENHYAQAHP